MAKNDQAVIILLTGEKIKIMKKNKIADLNKKKNADLTLPFYWKASQFENVPRHEWWYISIFIALVSLLTYGLFSNNFLLGIIVILVGLLLYLFEKKDPQVFKFGVTNQGIVAHDNVYKYSEIDDFWIFYEPGEHGRKELSLKSKRKFMPYIHIPLGSTDPVKLRRVLLPYIHEEEHDEGIVDAIERFF